MKKGLSLFLIIIQGLFLNAQSLTVTGDNSVLTSDACLTTHSYLTVTNVSNKEQEILCEKNVIAQSLTMSNYFCWGGNCYGASQFISGSSLILQSGEVNKTSFGGYFDAFCEIGSGTIEYCFYPIDDPNDRSCIMITYHGAATDIIENEKDHLIDEFFPNPTKEYATINYISGKNSHLKIIDILGNKVKEIYLSNAGKQDIYFGDLSKGIYFGNFIHNDKIISVKKLIIK